LQTLRYIHLLLHNFDIEKMLHLVQGIYLYTFLTQQAK